MASNYTTDESVETVHETEEPRATEVRCSRCRGLGWVLVYEQETDCMECEGYGSVLI